MAFRHQSVMLQETIDLLNIRQGGIYVDGTLGGGGHSEEILRRLSGTGHLYGIDRDEDALQAASIRIFRRFPETFMILGVYWRTEVSRWLTESFWI